MSNIAVNDKGEAVVFDGTAWKPAPVAENDKGERVVFDGKAWVSLTPKDPTDVVVEAGKTAGKAVNAGVNWAGTQLTKGATSVLGMPSALGDLAQTGAKWAGEKLGAPKTGETAGNVAKSLLTFGGVTPTTEKLNELIFGQGQVGVSMPFGIPPMTVPAVGAPEVNAADNPALTVNGVNVGKMLDTGMQAVPGMLAAPGGAMARFLPAMTGGMASEAAGQATEGHWSELPARLAGGLAGGVAGARMVTPLPANLTPEQARLNQIARERNVPLTVGQETGRGRAVESALARFPTSQGVMARSANRQDQAINREAFDEMGFVGNRTDTATMGAAHRQASDEFNAARNASGDVPLTGQFFRSAGREAQDYVDLVGQNNQLPVVSKTLANFLDPKLAKGSSTPTLSPEQYQQFRSDIVTAIGKVDQPAARNALKGIREALDDAMQASLPKDQAEAWQTARRHWANYKIIAKAAAGGSVESRAAGNLTPAALKQALLQRQGPDRYAETQGGMNDIARLSGHLADTRPNSGTPQTAWMQNLLSGGALSGGAGLGFALGGLPGAAYVAGGLAAPNLFARGMTGQGAVVAPLVRNYLANQALAHPAETIATVPFALAPNLLTDQRRGRQ